LLGRDPQPATMGYVKTSSDNGGVHTNSGIPNHAFYLAATALGGVRGTGRIWRGACDSGSSERRRLRSSRATPS
jgi:Zn-dependent metalloprotease